MEEGNDQTDEDRVVADYKKRIAELEAKAATRIQNLARSYLQSAGRPTPAAAAPPPIKKEKKVEKKNNQKPASKRRDRKRRDRSRDRKRRDRFADECIKEIAHLEATLEDHVAETNERIAKLKAFVAEYYEATWPTAAGKRDRDVMGALDLFLAKVGRRTDGRSFFARDS